MKTQVLRIAAMLSLFVGIGTAQAHSYYYHHGHCGGWGGRWGGGWYGPGWGGWGPPVSIGFSPGWGPGYYYPSTSVIVSTQPTDVFYKSGHTSNSVLVKAQARLKNLGYYKGSVDGSFGPATRKAVEMFQGENGLPVTGRLDSQTLRQLKVST